MKARDFKLFKERVAKAYNTDVIWWCGYYFMDLNDKQGLEVMEILKKNPACTVLSNGVRIPSGLEFIER